MDQSGFKEEKHTEAIEEGDEGYYFFAEKIFDDTVFYFIRDSLALQQAALYFLRLLRDAGGLLDLLTNLGWPELCLSIQALTLTLMLLIHIIYLSV